MPEHRFSEVTLKFSEQVANLNRARSIFEQEATDFSQLVLQHLVELVRRPNQAKIQKTRWRECTDWSSQRDVTWLNFFAGSYVRLDVRLPGKRNFRKAAAYVYFQFLFDRELEKFVYQCRFENQNLVHDGLDETVSELAAQKGESTFPGAYHVKSDTAVVFRRLITDTLFDELGGSVDDAIELVEEAVDVLFPNSHYAVPAEEDDELAEVDDDE